MPKIKSISRNIEQHCISLQNCDEQCTIYRVNSNLAVSNVCLAANLYFSARRYIINYVDAQLIYIYKNAILPWKANIINLMPPEKTIFLQITFFFIK